MCFFVQPQSMEELTTEAVQDDVEIQNDAQTDAFAVSTVQAPLQGCLSVCHFSKLHLLKK